MKYWFTLGYGHWQYIGNDYIDRHVIVEIDGTYAVAKSKMFVAFGKNWGDQYEPHRLDASRFTGGIYLLDKKEFVKC